jgi:hypothetical protein
LETCKNVNKNNNDKCHCYNIPKILFFEVYDTEISYCSNKEKADFLNEYLSQFPQLTHQKSNDRLSVIEGSTYNPISLLSNQKRLKLLLQINLKISNSA